MTKAWRIVLPLILVAGCAGRVEEGPGGEEPGRFTHSAIQVTVAPWDGAATQVFLAEAPLKRPLKGAPFVVLQVYKPISTLSGQRFVLEGTDKRLGGAMWAGADGTRQSLPWAAVSFEEVAEGAPVEGSYEVQMPDGSRARGRFRAERWPSEGPGG
jgi:hypothetical protein